MKEAYNRIYYGSRDKGVFTRNVMEIYDVLNDNYQYTEEIQTTIYQLKSTTYVPFSYVIDVEQI